MSMVARTSVRELEDNIHAQPSSTAWSPELKSATTHTSEEISLGTSSALDKTPTDQDYHDTQSPQRAGSIRTWKWELFTWLLGTIGFATNIVILLRFDGERQSKWKSSVQITTLVAALAQLSQSALLVPVSFCIRQLAWTWFRTDRCAMDVDRFDLASRGPDGSMRLLYRLGWRPRLVSLGAVATILLLAFPSFFQQAVSTQPKEYALPGVGVASVQRLVSFVNTTDTNRSDWDTFTAIDLGLINHELYPSNASGNCPTTHCTWAPYTSFGVSVMTEDVTNLLVTEPDLPAFVQLANHSFQDPSAGDQGWLNRSTFQVDVRRIFSPEYPTPEGKDGRLADLAHVYLSYYDPCLNINNTDLNWRDVKYWRAFKATFKLSLLRLQSTHSILMDTKVLRSDDDLPWKVIPYPSITGLATRRLYCAEEDGDNFCIRSDLLGTLGFGISWAMDPNMMWASYPPIPLNTSKLGNVKELSYQTTFGDRVQYILPDVLGKDTMYGCKKQAGIGLEGFTRKMNNMAVGLSNSFRTNSNYNSTRLNGTAWESEPHIQVSYAWLTFPIALYSIITIFLFATMFHTRNAPPWKSCILALLRCMDPKNAMGTLDEIEDYGKKTTVRLEEVRHGETWHLLDATPKEQIC